MAWFLIWQTATLLIDNSILLTGPADVAFRLISDIGRAEYWQTVGLSLFRITAGFLSAFFMGIVLGMGAFIWRGMKEFLEPFVALLKSIPVASFVVIVLIWTGSAYLTPIISFLVVFPAIYVSTINGMEQADKKMVEMAKIFAMHPFNKYRYIYRSSFLPMLISSCQTAIGMSFKSGVAAEIIGTPAYSMGERIYMSKIYLDTTGVLSWTITVVIVSTLCEKLWGRLFRYYETWMPSPVVNKRRPGKDEKERGLEKEAPCIEIQKLAKAFQETDVLKEINMTLKKGDIYILQEPSGHGKTTLFRCLAGLEKPDAGYIAGMSSKDCAMVFQEDRLCEEVDAVNNVLMSGKVFSPREEVEKQLLTLLPYDSIHKKVKELSGGMKRRVALCRAVESECRVMLLDEPFSGMDKGTKESVITYLLRRKGSRTVLISTHQKEDIELLKGQVIEF